MKILIVEDDARLGDTLRTLLIEQGYDVDLVENGRDGYEYAADGYYDVMILDVMLPEMNGYEVAGKLREKKTKIPILMLTAKESWQDKVRGLDAGADDYLTKPFVPEELYARVRALTRRTGEVIMNELVYEDLVLNLSRNEILCEKRKVKLPAKECAIMKLLMSNPNQIVTKEEVIHHVWKMEDEVEDNNVEVYISFLRKKLKAIQTKVTIETVRKVGYHLGQQRELE